MGVYLGRASGIDGYAKAFRAKEGYGHGPCPACGGTCSWWTGDPSFLPWTCPKMPEGWSGSEDHQTVDWTGPIAKFHHGFRDKCLEDRIDVGRIVELHIRPTILWKSDGWYGCLEAYSHMANLFSSELSFGPFHELTDAIEAASTERVDRALLGAEFERLTCRFDAAFNKLHDVKTTAFHRALEKARR